MYRANDKTAYLGDENSYSHAAAAQLIGGELTGYARLSDVISAARSGECAHAVLPLENNVEGTVNEVYDALFDSGLYIAKQLVLPVRHSLIAADGVDVGGIRRILSHPQAIAQCRNFLSGLTATVEAVSSTSAALGKVCGDTAAIAFGPISGTHAVATCIQDSALNATRFALVSLTRCDDGDTVSVSFDLKNESGALLGALAAIHRRAVNLTRILSRPHRSGSGKYRFFADFDFTGTREQLDTLLDEVAERCEELRFLGRYYCAAAKY